MASANFADSYVDTEREQRTLQQLVSSCSASLRVLPAAEPADLQQALSDQDAQRNIDIFHFSGHACRDRGLHLRGSGRGRVYLAGTELQQLLQNSSIKLVVLNACHSDALAVILSEVVPVAIGTTRRIRDVVARQFTGNFYRALMQGSTISSAFEFALGEQKPAASPAYIIVENQTDGDIVHKTIPVLRNNMR